MESFARGLVDIAPLTPVLADDQGGVDRATQDLGRTVPLFLGDFFADFVEEGEDRRECVTRARAQLQPGARRQFGVPFEALDDFRSAVAGYFTEVDEVRLQRDLGGITRRE